MVVCWQQNDHAAAALGRWPPPEKSVRSYSASACRSVPTCSIPITYQHRLISPTPERSHDHELDGDGPDQQD